MKADQLRPILQHYSRHLLGADPVSAGKLESFSEQFEQLGSQTLKKILNVKTITQAKGRLREEDFARDDVSSHLRWLADLLKITGHKDSAEIALIVQLIDEEFWGSSGAFISAVTMPKVTKSSAQPVRLDIVRSYSEELARVEHDNNAFDHLIGRIKSDRNVRKQEMHEIACRFFGYRVTLAPKNKLLQRIIDLQAKDARQEARTKLGE